MRKPLLAALLALLVGGCMVRTRLRASNYRHADGLASE
jgi:hypothetical protein